MKKPIIVGIKGEASNFVKKANCGISVTPEDPKMFSNAILSYYENDDLYHKHGKKTAQHISKRNLKKEMLISNLIKQVNSNA